MRCSYHVWVDLRYYTYILLLNRLCFHPESFSNQNFNSFEMFRYETEFDESWFDESQDIFHIENTINITEVT